MKIQLQRPEPPRFLKQQGQHLHIETRHPHRDLDACQERRVRGADLREQVRHGVEADSDFVAVEEGCRFGVDLLADAQDGGVERRRGDDV